MTLFADVAVIGGGPAGAAAARLLASWGQSVIVLARAAATAAVGRVAPAELCEALRRDRGSRGGRSRRLHSRHREHRAMGRPRAARRDVRSRGDSAIRYRATSSTNSCSPARRSPARRSSATSPCVKRSARATCGECRSIGVGPPARTRYARDGFSTAVDERASSRVVDGGDQTRRRERSPSREFGNAATHGHSRMRRTRSSRATRTDGRGPFPSRPRAGSSP